MHDWTLLTLLYDWKTACVTLNLINPSSQTVCLTANKVIKLSVPRRDEWGPSVSVLGIDGPMQQRDGTQLLRIEMQTGDVIEIQASSFLIPTDVPWISPLERFREAIGPSRVMMAWCNSLPTP